MEFDGECYKHLRYMEGINCLTDGSETLLDIFLNNGMYKPTQNAYGVIVGESLKWISYSEALDKVLKLYDFFKSNISKKSIVGIYSINRYEWLISEHTIYALGCISCPLYSTFGIDAIKYIIEQTSMEVCFISGEKADYLYKYVLVNTKTTIKMVIVFDKFNSKDDYENIGIKVYYIHDVLNRDYKSQSFLEDLLNDKFRKPKSEDISTICYTSGTSGFPKGVVLTHKNFIANISAFFRPADNYSFYEITEEDVYISYLPLSHVMERICVHTIISKGASIGFYRGVIKELAKDYKIIRPTFIAGVPRVFNLFMDKIMEKVEKKNILQRFIFKLALEWKYLIQKLGIYTSFWDYIIFKKVKKEFGGRIKACLSGSAPLNEDVIRFLQAALSCKIFQGYGQTETTAACIVSTMQERKINSVGVPFPSNKIKLVSLGEEYNNQLEIWVKGDNVFKGYFKNEAETKESFEDGWFKTGDIGIIEDDLFKIVGRKKEIFKTSRGEYIVPEKIENILKCTEIDDILITGKSTEDYIVAIAVCTKDLATNFIQNTIWAMAKKALEEKKIMNFEVPRKILIIREDFSRLGEVITPTGKKKRALLEKKLDNKIQSLYEKTASNRL